jgi:hypothetical protein
MRACWTVSVDRKGEGERERGREREREREVEREFVKVCASIGEFLCICAILRQGRAKLPQGNPRNQEKYATLEPEP